MPKRAVPLTDTKIRNTQPAPKDLVLFDGDGFFMLIKPSGSKLWRFKYRHMGRNTMLGMGTYPEVSLKDARGKRDQARQLLAGGTDPSTARKEHRKAQEATTTTFAIVFAEWLDIQASELAPTTLNKIRASMAIHAVPHIGAMPIGDIKVADILGMLRIIEAKGALEMARRIRAWTSRVFRYAIITERCQKDPAADLRGALRVPVVTHHAAQATTDLTAFIDALNDPLTRLAPSPA